ncbi:hypothetical protein QBC32DRAFT_4474 [Pseudoneurospora amorphoporcata]|uniref:Uncharacterized protein n=1 Tax=Pseudoneurospora amorphoporcata TaxID=241081 RepID=A0AAN6SFE7_9PEZI|nr:hypothetical protein QBC32DRAFT_4474 [Pseudoneurospora amorphoporcata]
MSTKPVLKLSTPVTANFPNIPRPTDELRSAVTLPSALSDRTPLSAISRTSAFRDPLSALPSAGLPSAGPFSATLKMDHDLQKTPITPPVAYLDFLKCMQLVSPSLASPPQTGKAPLNRTSTASSLSTSSTTSNDSESSIDSATTDDSEKEKEGQIESAPSTARSDVSSQPEIKVEAEEKGDKKEDRENADNGKQEKPRPAPIAISQPPTPHSSLYPMSAPATGAAVFPSTKIPPSPAISTSALYSPRTPLSAASVRSPFDWEAALKLRRFAEVSSLKRSAPSDAPAASNPTSVPAKESRSSIRHIREVVTRTVTYTPRMAPAPKGKRRKIDADTAIKS